MPTFRQRLRTIVDESVVPALRESVYIKLYQMLDEVEEYHYTEGKKVGREEGKEAKLQEIKETLFERLTK